jgi:hypothetical protein
MAKELERRAYIRYDMKLPATIQPVPGNDENEYHLLLTRDISHMGAYFNMMKTFPYDGQIQVEILIEVSNHRNQSIYLYMTTSGEVVRCDESGLAVSFDEDFRLSPFPAR